MYRKVALAIMLVLFTASTAWSQSGKIGVINMKTVMEKSEAAKEAAANLEKKFDGKEKELKAKENELQQLMKDIEAQSMVLSQEAKQNKQIEFKRKYEDFMRLRENTKKDVQEERMHQLKPVLDVLGDVVETYGKKNGFSIIFDRLGVGVLYADQALDVTEEIVVELNKAWRAKKTEKKK
jgi:outer membrane protein